MHSHVQKQYTLHVNYNKLLKNTFHSVPDVSLSILQLALTSLQYTLNVNSFNTHYNVEKLLHTLCKNISKYRQSNFAQLPTTSPSCQHFIKIAIMSSSNVASQCTKCWHITASLLLHHKYLCSCLDWNITFGLLSITEMNVPDHTLLQRVISAPFSISS